jgi:hypothetical protein
MQNEAIWIIDSDYDDQDVVRQIWKDHLQKSAVKCQVKRLVDKAKFEG